MAAISLILFALGAGFGFASVSPWSNSNLSATTFGVATAIWLIITQWLAAAFGGYLTGRLRTKWVLAPSDEIYFRDTAHGFLAWAVAAVIAAAILTSATSALVGETAQVAGMATASPVQGAAGNAASRSVSTVFDPTAYLVDELFRSNNPNVREDTHAARTEATPIVARGLSEGSIPAADKTYLAQLVVAYTGLSQPDAAKRVEEVEAQVKTAWLRAQHATDQAHKAASYLAFFTAFSMLIGAFIAAVGATIAGHRRDESPALRAA